MDWNDATDLNIKTLRRIVALLLALAGLAERASGRCHAVRWSVLWLLRPGEAIARDYVAALTRDAGLEIQFAPDAIASSGNSAADATHLADCFRTLAALLSTLVEQVLAPLRAVPAHPSWLDRAQRATGVFASLVNRSPTTCFDSS